MTNPPMKLPIINPIWESTLKTAKPRPTFVEISEIRALTAGVCADMKNPCIARKLRSIAAEVANAMKKKNKPPTPTPNRRNGFLR